jgi:type I restriction enzyme S subunit
MPLAPLCNLLRLRTPDIVVSPAATYDFAGVKSFGGGVFRGPSKAGSQFSYRRLSRIRSGQFIYPKLMAWEGALGIVPGNLDGLFVSPEFCVFDVDRDAADPRWIDYYFRQASVWPRLSSGSSGTNIRRRRIYPADFLKHQVPLPPLAEQRRIVAKIERLAGLVEEAKGLNFATCQGASTLGQAAIDRLFTAVAKRVGVTRLGELEPHVTSGPRNWSQHQSETGERFYRAQDIGPDGRTLDGSRLFITPPNGQQGRIAHLEPGDLMIVITGATVGRVALFSDSHESGFVSQHVAICRLPQSRVLPEYGLYCLRSPQGRGQLLGQRYGQGKPGLNLTNIRNIAIPIPSFDEQERVLGRARAVEARLGAILREEQNVRAEIDAMVPAILDRAFKGDL